MRKSVSRFIAFGCVVASLAIATPAQASWAESFGHTGMFDRFTYAGTAYSTKSFYLIDRVGTGYMSTSMHQAMAGFANQWNAELQSRGWYGILPAIAYVRDDAGVAQCTSSGWDGAPIPLPQATGYEYSYVLACQGSPTGDIGVSRGSGPNVRHIRGAHIFPYAFCAALVNSQARSIGQYKSCWAHEIGHLMGIPHNNTNGNLMNTNGSGVTAEAWYSSDMWQSLRNLYPSMSQD